VLFTDPEAPRRVREELAQELAHHGYGSVAEARGAAHLVESAVNVGADREAPV